jgi:ABC-type hemin transport system substrate-binding protein
MTERSFERAPGLEGVRKLPGVALTPAGRSGRVIPVSAMYLQGFDRGMGKAVIALYNKTFPGLKKITVRIITK